VGRAVGRALLGRRPDGRGQSVLEWIGFTTMAVLYSITSIFFFAVGSSRLGVRAAVRHRVGVERGAPARGVAHRLPTDLVQRAPAGTRGGLSHPLARRPAVRQRREKSTPGSHERMHFVCRFPLAV